MKKQRHNLEGAIVILEVTDVRVPLRGELYLNKNREVQRRLDSPTSRRSEIRPILKIASLPKELK